MKKSDTLGQNECRAFQQEVDLASESAQLGRPPRSAIFKTVMNNANNNNNNNKNKNNSKNNNNKENNNEKTMTWVTIQR